VEEVADEEDFAPGQFAHRLAHGERVEQGLRGMGVVAVARIDHGGRCVLGNEGGNPGARVAHNHVVDFHRLHGFHRVEDRLAFGHA
jgi:hypothetical protein